MRVTGPHRLAASDDPVSPGSTTTITVRVDGQSMTGLAGQTIAGILLSAGRASWRTTRKGRPRGIFCGIGVCYDCLLTVNGLRDVRACQRRAVDGDVITTKDEISDEAVAVSGAGASRAASEEKSASAWLTDPPPAPGAPAGEAGP